MDAIPVPEPVPTRASYALTRFLFLRLLGLVYLVAFLCAAHQVIPLLGRNGLLPVQLFLDRVRTGGGSGASAFWRVPTIFWIDASDAFLQGAAWLGVALSALVLAGFANALVLTALWLLYMSFVHVGQIFYGYGWEILLLETGFLAIFLVPPLRLGPFSSRMPPPHAVIVLLRWLAFRVMFGAGLIKLRGDPCWRDLTCLSYHYETQPIPNPLSWYLHQTPAWFHKLEVLWNHVVEIGAPLCVFGPRRARIVAGCLLVAFQVSLILSGNLSWLNYLTIAVCVSCFDDRCLAWLAPERLRAKARALVAVERASRARRVVTWALVALVALLSINPALNMISPGQIMNTSFEPFDLVNTYGAFGSIGRTRPQLVLEGTYDATLSENTRWLEYDLKCQPGDVLRRPCVVSPYHERLDWQMWFAAMSDIRREPWLVHLVYQLLRGDAGARSLLGQDPFEHGPPHYIRLELYEYHFTRVGDPSGAWWRRDRVASYLAPISLDDPRLTEFVERQGWSR